MPVQIKFDFDGGAAEFQRILNTGADKIKNFTTLWEYMVAYFEGKSGHAVSGIEPQAPILGIYESEGAKIGGSWEISPRYAEWKDENWSAARVFSVPLNRNNKQVLSGATLDSLLNSNNPEAIREISPMQLVYGSSVPWAADNQSSKIILDIYPDMDTGMGRVMRLWLHDIIPELDDTGDKA